MSISTNSSSSTVTVQPILCRCHSPCYCEQSNTNNNTNNTNNIQTCSPSKDYFQDSRIIQRKKRFGFKNSSNAIYYAMNWPNHKDEDKKPYINPNAPILACHCKLPCDCMKLLLKQQIIQELEKETQDEVQHERLKKKLEQVESAVIGSQIIIRKQENKQEKQRIPCQHEQIHKQEIKQENQEQQHKTPTEHNNTNKQAKCSPSKRIINGPHTNTHSNHHSSSFHNTPLDEVLASARKSSFSADHHDSSVDPAAAAVHAATTHTSHTNPSILADEKYYERNNLKQVERRLKIDAFHKKQEENRLKSTIKDKISRDHSSSAIASLTHRPVFHDYGNGNIHPINGGVIYGDYLYSHNVVPDSNPNHPTQVQSYFTARFAAEKRRNENLEALDRLTHRDENSPFTPNKSAKPIRIQVLDQVKQHQTSQQMKRVKARRAAQAQAEKAQNEHNRIITGKHQFIQRKGEKQEEKEEKEEDFNSGYKPDNLDEEEPRSVSNVLLSWPKDYNVEERKYGNETTTEYNIQFGPKTAILEQIPHNSVDGPKQGNNHQNNKNTATNSTKSPAKVFSALFTVNS